MDKTISCDDLETAISLLGPRPPCVEVWVRDYIPKGCSFKVVLKDLLTTVSTYLPRTEEIYMMSVEDLSMEMVKILRGANVPVFAPSGKRLC